MEIADKSAWYEKRRNELLALLEETTKLEIPESLADELKAIRTKCLENQFEIGLVGEFQGGKSTTFNALCDGRDLSPRGLGGGGIKTSAALVSAQNIAGDEKRDGMSEWAEITFKTKFQIQQGMFDLVKSELLEDESFRKLFPDLSDEKFDQQMMSADAFAATFDLDNAGHRAALRRALDKLWKTWHSDKSSLTDDELDQLRIATLQERFYGTPEYLNVLEKIVVGVYDFQSLITFPKDWMQRWTAGEKATFSFTEIAFVFVRSTLLRIHSKSLARLGCRVTDCPGLFANSYDTSVAKRAILVSDGVWYLIGGEKQIGEKDLKILDEIKKMGMAAKTTASVNLKGSHEDKLGSVFPATEATLQNKGFTLELLPYNARLSFLAAQGGLILKHPGKLSPLDLDCMKIDSKWKDGKPDSPAVMWTTMVRKAGASTELDNVANILDLAEESVATVRKESFIDDVMAALANEIVEKKARSILVDNGSAKAANALSGYERSLKVVEDAAQKTEEKFKDETDKALASLREYVDKSKEIIRNSPLKTESEMLSERIVSDLFDASFSEAMIRHLAEQISEILSKHAKICYLTPKRFARAVQSEVAPVVVNEIKTAIVSTFESWKETDGTGTGWNALESRKRSLIEKLTTLWNEYQKDDSFSGFSFIPPHEEAFDECLSSMQNMILSGRDLGSNIKKIGGILNVDIANKVVSYISWAMVGMVISALFGPVGIIAAVIASWFAADKIKERQIGKQYLKIMEALLTQFDSVDFRGSWATTFIPIFNDMQKNAVLSYSETVSEMIDRFKTERVLPAQENFKKSQEDRTRIAQTNRQIRVEQIEPVRRKIQDFEQVVSAEL